MLALSFAPSAGKFSVLWDIPMIPKYQAEAGWSGASVWGSQPSIDTNRGQVFIATANWEYVFDPRGHNRLPNCNSERYSSS